MRSAIAVLVAAGAALVAPGPALAGGESSQPKPACSEDVMRDERGDAENPGLDMLGVFLTESLGTSFANVVVADLDGKVDQPDSTQELFTLYYRDDDGDTERRQARLYDDGRREGATWFDGVEGIVQFRLPSLTPGTPTALTIQTGGENQIAHIQTRLIDARVTPFPSSADTLESGTQPGRCASSKPVTTAPPASPAPAAEAPAETRPTVTAGTLRLRGRTLRVPLRSTGRVTDIRGRLTRKGRVVAHGRLAELDGRAVLVLTARRAFRPGSYWLSIPGVLERRVRIA